MLGELKTAMGKGYLFEGVQEEAFSFPQKAVALKIKRSSFNGKQVSIYNFMQRNENTSLLLLVRKGYSISGKRSEQSSVKLNPLFEDLVVKAIVQQAITQSSTVVPKHATAETKEYGQFSFRANIDRKSLLAFIECTQQLYFSTKKEEHYKHALLQNLMAAMHLAELAQELNGEHFIEEHWNTADSGRIFGLGSSLQRQRKIVRDAALGVCHKYDFKACAFAVMAGLASTINSKLKVPAVLDYVNNRAQIRKRIAAEVGISVNLVKEAFTSIGFGAELKDNYKCAIRSKIQKAAHIAYNGGVYIEDKELFANMGKAEFDRLMANITFMEIYNEFHLINETILNSSHLFGCGDLGFRPYKEVNEKGRKRSYRTLLAYIYQSLEAVAMQQFSALTNQNPLLTTHDCIYLKTKLTATEIANITSKLQEDVPFQYLSFEYQSIFPITTREMYYGRYEEQREFERAHKEKKAKANLTAMAQQFDFEVKDEEEIMGDFDEITQMEMDEYRQYEIDKGGEFKWRMMANNRYHFSSCVGYEKDADEKQDEVAVLVQKIEFHPSVVQLFGFQ
jgi:hypothetical protein